MELYLIVTFQVLTKKGRKSRAHAVSKASGLKVLTRGVARTNFRCVAKQAMIVPKIKKHVLNMLKRDIQSDIKHVLRNNCVNPSGVFCRCSWEVLMEYASN